MIKYIIGYLICINSFGFLSMRSDKQRAIHKKYRISEKRLFGIALLGGSIGSYIGMQVFRHKTKHWYFKYLMPCIIVLQLVLAYGVSRIL